MGSREKTVKWRLHGASIGTGKRHGSGSRVEESIVTSVIFCIRRSITDTSETWRATRAKATRPHGPGKESEGPIYLSGYVLDLSHSIASDSRN